MESDLMRAAIQSGIFAALFVMLLYWVLKTNDNREKRYQKTIDELANKLGVVEDIRRVVCEIKEDIKEVRR